MEQREQISVLDERIRSFLREAVQQWIPARDQPLSQTIGTELAPLLVSTEPIALVSTLASSVAQSFRGEPNSWNQLVHLAGLYLDTLWSDDERLGSSGMSQTVDGCKRHAVNTGLSVALLKALLQEASEDERTTFWKSLHEWTVLVSLEKVLPDLALSEQELALLVRRLEEIGARDAAASRLQGAIRNWASRNPQQAMRAVDGELGAIEPQLPLTYFEMLVEGAVLAAPDGWEHWREGTIERLLSSPRKEWWRLALWLECFAWPSGTSAAKRHELLLRHVQRFPSMFSEEGLAILYRDSWEHPEESTRAALVILRQVRKYAPELTQRVLQHLPELAFSLADKVKKGSSPKSLIDVVGQLVELPLAERNSSMDAALQALAASSMDFLQEFLGEWLGRSERYLRSQNSSLHEILPLTFEQIAGRLPQWIFGWLVADSELVRRAAQHLLSDENLASMSLEAESFASLGPLKAQALAHVLACARSSGDVWIPILYRLAEVRPETFEIASKVLLDEAVFDYPGVCKEQVESRERSPSKGESEHELCMEALRRGMAEKLDVLRATFLRQNDIPELHAVRPCASTWNATFHRVMQQQMRRASQGSVFAQLVTTVPIARGEATIMAKGDLLPLQHMEQRFAIATSAREVEDVVGLRRSRVLHMQEALRLIKSAQGGAA